MAPKDGLTPRRDGATLGEKFRNTINPALEDSRRAEAQYEMINGFFAGMAEKLETIINHHIQGFFNEVARMDAKLPDATNLFIIESITTGGQGGQPTFLRMGVPLNPLFLELSADDIKDMPGYIALHVKARELDVALNLTGMTREEVQAHGVNAQPPYLTVNMMQSYEDGAMANSTLYPNLPPVPPRLNKRDNARDFVL